MTQLETADSFCTRLGISSETLTELVQAGIVMEATINDLRFVAQIRSIYDTAFANVNTDKYNLGKRLILLRLSKKGPLSAYKLLQAIAPRGFKAPEAKAVIARMLSEGLINVVLNAPRDSEKIYSISA